MCAQHTGDGERRIPSREELDELLSGIGPRRSAFNRAFVGMADATSGWLRRHWLGLVNGILGAYIGVAVLTPVAYALGLTGPASAVFRAYRIVCDQIPSHSFFIGGYQICLCSRCLAIYSTILLAGIVLAAVRQARRVPAITWWIWLLTILPLALDGGTQFFGWRESNNGLRVLTGIIFGIGTALFTLPHLESSANDEPAPARRIAR